MSHIVLDHTLVQHKLSYLRDRKTSGTQFRQLVEEIGLLIAVIVVLAVILIVLLRKKRGDK